MKFSRRLFLFLISNQLLLINQRIKKNKPINNAIEPSHNKSPKTIINTIPAIPKIAANFKSPDIFRFSPFASETFLYSLIFFFISSLSSFLSTLDKDLKDDITLTTMITIVEKR